VFLLQDSLYISRWITKPPASLRFEGAFARRASRAGLDVAQAIGRECDLGIRVSADLAKVIEQAQAHVAAQDLGA
jgi:hypothetical protein